MSKPLIDFWSYSSMSTLLNNPMAFKKQYILKQYDNQTSPSALIGHAGHKALELYHQGMERDAAIGEGLKLINETTDMGIDYGKTGTRANIIAVYTQAINFAFEELPVFHELLGVEEAITVDINNISGSSMSLPAKAKMDIIARNSLGELEIHDWKFTKTYTDGDIDDFKKWLQAMFNYYVVKAKYGEAPKRMVYQEIKVSKNSGDNAGQPQRQSYTYEFGSAADFATFEKLYNECTTQIMLPGYQFLPNPSDVFNGQDMFEIYRQGIMGVEAPVAVSHKTEQTTYADKAFVPSVSDRVESANYSMEERIRLKMQEFVGAVQMQETHEGPSVTQYTLKVSRGIPMSKIARMGPDLALALEARSLRVEAPIPGTGLVGIEVPSAVRRTVELADSHLRMGTLELPIGVNLHNQVVYKDLADMPHLLVAGATGAGKSVMLNVIIQTLTKQLTPEQLQLVLVDPKQVEFAPFENLPHLVQPVVYDNRGAAEVLAETVKEMDDRYKALRRRNVRTIADYNKKPGNKMPYRVLILDEFADLMMTVEKTPIGSMNIGTLTENIKMMVEEGKSGRITKKAIKAAIDYTLDDGIPPAEESIIRIAQKARAVGIHIVLATQRPSADVVTGLLKANIPTKIAFMTSSKVNSQIVLDQPGAEELTGKGDMLFSDPSHSGLQRLQGLYA